MTSVQTQQNNLIKYNLNAGKYLQPKLYYTAKLQQQKKDNSIVN